MTTRLVRQVLRLQAMYYLVTGLWPFVSLRTFEAISGPKADDWLVRTVGALVSSVGVVLLRAERRAPRAGVSDDALLTAAASAVSLAAIDVWYAGRGRISKVDLLDALPELGFAAVSALALRARRGRSRSA